MIIDKRKKNLVELGNLDAGDGFVLDGKYYMVIERDSVEVDFDYVPALALEDSIFEEWDRHTDVEPCRYEINVYN